MSYRDLAFPFFVFLALASLVKLWRNSAAGQRPWLMTIWIAGITVLSLNPIACLFSLPLDVSYEHDQIPKDTVAAIVVLTGAASPPIPHQYPYAVVRQDSYIRLERAACLSKQSGAPQVIACRSGEN